MPTATTVSCAQFRDGHVAIARAIADPIAAAGQTRAAATGGCRVRLWPPPPSARGYPIVRTQAPPRTHAAHDQRLAACQRRPAARAACLLRRAAHQRQSDRSRFSAARAGHDPRRANGERKRPRRDRLGGLRAFAAGNASRRSSASLRIMDFSSEMELGWDISLSHARP